jgi:hypothetical protein
LIIGMNITMREMPANHLGTPGAALKSSIRIGIGLVPEYPEKNSYSPVTTQEISGV